MKSSQPIAVFKNGFWVIGTLLGLGGTIPDAWSVTKITSINFEGTGDPSQLDIQGDGELKYVKTENQQDKQIILEFSDASLDAAANNKLDTSGYNSQVSLVSPYPVDGSANTVRVVLQEKTFTPADVSVQGNLVSVKIAQGTPGLAPAPIADASAAIPPPLPGAPAATPPASAPVAGADTPPVSPTVPPVVAETAVSPHLKEFEEAEKTHHFHGKPVSLQVRDVDISDVLRLIGDASGFNIVMGDDVKGKLSLSLTDVPWDQALDVVLHTLHLGAERSNNILRVVTLKNLTTEKIEEYRANLASKFTSPHITRIFPISYAKLADLQGILSKFSSTPLDKAPGGGNASAAELMQTPAIIQVDNRTNSIIVNDLPENIEKIKKIIEVLDTQTPQVLIEAKMVEATEDFSSVLAGSLGFGGTGTSPFFASIAGGDPLDNLIGSPGLFSSPVSIASQSGSSSSLGFNNGTFGLTPNMSFLPGISKLNALLSWGESQDQVKIVSSPKTVVLNKESATIVEGTPVLVPGVTTVAGVGTVQTAQVSNADISMTVRPTVTNDASVLLDLKVTKDIPVSLPGSTSQAIGTRNMTTLVLVESGSTLVIGGIYTMQNTHTESGIPFLRKLPLIGALFGSVADQTSRSELFFFITPRIINPKEAGLTAVAAAAS